ncbi:MAG: DUF2889 domain-containing protein [Deltaproteobacteria bacterium]|nr:DUF2889 domain-containing protein [Deltaproteobacteria bacterium]
MILDFYRNKIVEVEPLPDGALAVYWRLKDSLMEAAVELKIMPPDLAITEANASLKRAVHEECRAVQDMIQKVVGVRIGAGLRKIVRGTLGEQDGCQVLTAAVLESANAVILHFTRLTLQPGDDVGDEEKIEGAKAILKTNPRMAGSCVVYAEGSPVMQG